MNSLNFVWDGAKYTKTDAAVFYTKGRLTLSGGPLVPPMSISALQIYTIDYRRKV